MSNASSPLSDLAGPTLSPESREAMLRERVAALKSENADWKATIILRDNVIQLCYEEIHRLTRLAGAESSFMEWMETWGREEAEEANG